VRSVVRWEGACRWFAPRERGRQRSATDALFYASAELRGKVPRLEIFYVLRTRRIQAPWGGIPPFKLVSTHAPAFCRARATLMIPLPLPVCADADNNQKVAAIPYEQATGGAANAAAGGRGGARVEKVNNVSGSSAGAGSGEFHLYRKHRRDEEARLAGMARSHDAQLLDREHKERVERHAAEAEGKTAKNAEKRRKKRLRELAKRKLPAGASAAGGGGGEEDESEEEEEEEEGEDGAGGAPAAKRHAAAGSATPGAATASEGSAAPPGDARGDSQGGCQADTPG